MDLFEIQYLDIEERSECETIIKRAIEECFKIEELMDSKLYVSVTLTNPDNIKEYNKKYRNIDKPTDVLSFPMYEKEELDDKLKNKDFENYDILGDMVISIPQVELQAKEYGHSFARELAYMVVHSFYHLMGYDHIEESDKTAMREKEEAVLNILNLKR